MVVNVVVILYHVFFSFLGEETEISKEKIYIGNVEELFGFLFLFWGAN